MLSGPLKGTFPLCIEPDTVLLYTTIVDVHNDIDKTSLPLVVFFYANWLTYVPMCTSTLVCFATCTSTAW